MPPEPQGPALFRSVIWRTASPFRPERGIRDGRRGDASAIGQAGGFPLIKGMTRRRFDAPSCHSLEEPATGRGLPSLSRKELKEWIPAHQGNDEK